MARRWKNKSPSVEQSDRFILRVLEFSRIVHVFDVLVKTSPGWLRTGVLGIGSLAGFLPDTRIYLFLAFVFLAVALVVCVVIGAILRHYLGPHTEALVAALPLLVERSREHLTHPPLTIERRKENPKKKDTAEAKQISLWPIERSEKK